MSSPEKELTLILQQMSEFHSKWIALNDKCKSLQSALNEANCKNDDLEVKLTQCTEHAVKKEEENKKLTGIVKKLQKKLLTGSVHKLINALKQNICVYDEAVLPSISKLTKDVTINSDDSEMCSSEDEDDPESSLITVDISPKLVNNSINQTEDARSTSVIVSSCLNGEKVVAKKTPSSIELWAKNPSVSSIVPVSPSVQNIENVRIVDTNCNCSISSPCVLISSTTEEKHQATIISTNSSCVDELISPTSSSQSNNTSTNTTETGHVAVTQINVISDSLQDAVQPCSMNVPNIESLCVVEEHIVENSLENTLNTNLPKEVSSDLNNESSLNQKVVNENTANRKNRNEKPDVLACSSSMVVSKTSKDDISCEIMDVDMSDVDEIKSERIKRSCSSPSSMFESSPKRSCSKSPPWSYRNVKTKLKCLICEYEKMDNDETFETYLMFDNHIIEKHPNPFPPYIRCMLNNGQCTRHFHSRQNFHKHVRRAHSLDDPVLTSKTNQHKPLKCTSCGKLFLFQNDLQEHNAQIHGATSNQKKTNEKLCRKISEDGQSTKTNEKLYRKRSEDGQSTWVRSMAECEVCKKDNRLSVKYKLYDELDAHISKCHSDPFPEYFRCPYCQRHFKMVKWLTSHIMNKHPDKYSKSPLEKFLPFETPEIEGEQININVTDILVNSSVSTAREDLPLRILSPSTINKSVAAVVSSISASISK